MQYTHINAYILLIYLHTCRHTYIYISTYIPTNIHILHIHTNRPKNQCTDTYLHTEDT